MLEYLRHDDRPYPIYGANTVIQSVDVQSYIYNKNKKNKT